MIISRKLSLGYEAHCYSNIDKVNLYPPSLSERADTEQILEIHVFLKKV